MLGGDTAGVAAGVLTGDTSGISFDLMQDFSATGVSHMFSVSGLHTSIICMFFYQLLCIAKISKRKASIVSIAFVLFFIAVSGFAPSAVRAGIMLIAMFIGGIFGRTSDGLNSLGIAAFIITVIDPFWIFSASLQLSFWATFGILLGGMPLREFLIKYAKKIPIPPMRWFFVANIDFFAVGLCAVVFTLPISMFLFSEVSIVSSITNFMSVFPIMLVLICSILSVLFSVIPIVNFLCYPFALVTGLASNSLISNSVLLAKFSWATAPLKPPFVMLWLAGTLVLLGTAMLIKRSFKVVLLSSAISLAALIAGVVSYSAVTSPLLRVDILNVGDGFYLTVTQKGKSAVIAGKGDYNRMNRVRESLTGLGIKKVDYFFCSEDSAEMENEACAVSRYFDIDTAVMPQAREWYIDSSRQTLLGQNGSISLSKDVQIKYIFTDGYCFWLITYGDFSLLAAPVLSYNTEGLPADFLNADAIVCRSLTKVAGDRFASSNFVVVSSSGERAEAISAMLSEFGFASVTTGGRTVHIVSDGSEGFKVR
jgi:competence protein ComEC